MELSYTVLIQVIIMFILIGIGYTLAKTRKLTKIGADQMSSAVLLTVVSPCVLIKAYQKEFSGDLAYKLLIAALLSTAVQLLAMVIAHFAFAKKDEDKRYRINRFCSVYSNSGFMAIPILDAVLGSEGVFYGSAYLATFNLLTWTLGIYTCTADKKSLSLKNIIVNPGVLGVLVGLCLFVARIKLPYIIDSAVNYMAALNTPVAMIVLGAFLSKVNIVKAITNLSLYKVSFLRLILVPIIAILMFKLVPIDNIVVMSTIIPAACPSATIAALFASKYKLDSGYASEIVALTTIFSIVTIPFIVFLSQII